MLKIATWNVNSLKVRLPHVVAWLNEKKPDVLALQELKQPTDLFPFEDLAAAGYTAIVNGQKTYNGVAILTRAPIGGEDVCMAFPTMDDPQRRVLAATVRGVRILNLYIPNGESTTSEKYQYKLEWLQHLQQFVTQQSQIYPEMVIVGDFNIAPGDADVHNPESWAEQVLCSTPERAAFQALLTLGFQDCFRLHQQPEQSFSWWDYRLNAFKRNRGLRIDHILSSLSLAARCTRCYIDKEPRMWERPSDHAPVVAEFADASYPTEA